MCTRAVHGLKFCLVSRSSTRSHVADVCGAAKRAAGACYIDVAFLTLALRNCLRYVTLTSLTGERNGFLSANFKKIIDTISCFKSFSHYKIEIVLIRHEVFCLLNLTGLYVYLYP